MEIREQPFWCRLPYEEILLTAFKHQNIFQWKKIFYNYL